MFRKLAFILTAAAVLPAAAQAQKPTAPNCAMSSDGLFTASLFNWGSGISYKSCYGAISGNDNGNQTSQINNLWGSYGTFTLLGSSDGTDNGPFTTKNGAPLVLDSPLSGYFALTLKQANFFSVYLLYAANPISSINWDTRGASSNGGANDPDKISHAVLYAGPQMSTVPEPSTYILMGSGLVMLMGAARLRRRA